MNIQNILNRNREHYITFLIMFILLTLTACGDVLEKSNEKVEANRLYSIGGSILGLEGGGLILTINGADSIKIGSADTEFTFSKRLLRQTSYLVEVQNQPNGPKQHCLVENGDGVTEMAAVDNILLRCTSDVLPVYLAADWNDYFTVTPTGVATKCTGNETGKLDACLHSAEQRFLELNSLASCEGVTASDRLNLLKWRCETQASGIKIYSYSIKTGQGLSDVIDYLAEPPVWRENSLSVFIDDIEFVRTPSSLWWENDLLIEANIEKSNVGVGLLNQTGSIYIIQNSTSLPISILNDKIGLLIVPSAILSGGSVLSKNEYVVYGGGRLHLWIEGHIKAEIEPIGIFFSNVRYSVINKCIVEFALGSHEQLAAAGINMRGSSHNIIRACDIVNNKTGIVASNSSNFNYLLDLTLRDNRFEGIALVGNNNVIMQNLVYGDGDLNTWRPNLGIQVWGGGNMIYKSRVSGSGGVSIRGLDNIVSGLITQGNTMGFSTNINSNLVLFNVTAVNNIGTGVQLQNGSASSILSRVAAVNNGDSGIKILQTDASVFSDIASIDGPVGIQLDSSNSFFTGVLRVGTVFDPNFTQKWCDVSSTSTLPGLIDGSCTDSGREGSYTYGGNASDAFFSTGSAYSTFFGKVVADNINAAELGVSFFADIRDWYNFETPFRLWAISGSDDFPSTDQRGRCEVTASCVIWDWSLRSSDRLLRNIVTDFPTGDDYFRFDLTGGEIIFFLNHASERMDDGIGNDNTLCESNEHCIFNPNIGAYQGHGPLLLKQPADQFINGTISNVTMWQYQFNGVQ